MLKDSQRIIEAARSRDLPQPGMPLQLGEGLANIIKGKVFDEGLFYVVPPHKLHLHEGRATKTIPVTAELEPIFGANKSPETGLVTLDIEDLAPEIIAGEDVGLDRASLEAIRGGAREYFNMATQCVKHPHALEFLLRNLSERDQRQMELDQLRVARIEKVPPVSPGTLVRIDVLKRQDGVVMSCDPNLMPLGMAHNYGFSRHVQIETGHQVHQSSPYIEGLAQLAAAHPGIIGILTGLHYGNWSSHMYTARAVTERGHPFFIIPTYCFDAQTGMVDASQLRKFYQTMGLPGAEALPANGMAVPSCLIRHIREEVSFHPDTHLVNQPGARATESQVWGALAVLPGFASWLESQGIIADLKTISVITVPTIIGRMLSGQLEIATALDPDYSHNGLSLQWKLAPECLDIFAAAADSIGSQEKPSERAWYVKSAGTSGKKGVRYTNDGKVAKAPQLIEKIAGGNEEGKIFLIQPKIRSTHIQDGQERRLKTNVFLTGKQLDFSGSDCMLAPINQRAAHGGSQTQTCLIKVNGL